MGRKTLHPDERKTKTKQTSLAAVLKSLQTMHRCGKLTNVSTLFNVERLCTPKKRKIFPHLPTRKKWLTSLDLLNIACYYYHSEALYILLFTATSQQA